MIDLLGRVVNQQEFAVETGIRYSSIYGWSLSFEVLDASGAQSTSTFIVKH
ncbi:MAG: hypothetical protein IPK76_03705 [Lewinellaceae bacterium]|nr:hypothetical protein [Lewinellaceae bacterium]